MSKSKRVEQFKTLSLAVLVIFYLIAGINHFRDPDFYYPLIPDYLSEFTVAINWLSGLIEVGFSAALVFEKTRKYAVYGIVLMLTAFIPSHICFFDIGVCVPDGLCVPAWVPGARLLVIHPMLMYWAWIHRR